jgi:hypothetical protein
MSLLGRLFRRHRPDAMEIWLAESNATRGGLETRWTGEPAFEHAPDLDPSEVPPPDRVGFDGRALPENRGPISGLEGGRVAGPTTMYER